MAEVSASESATDPTDIRGPVRFGFLVLIAFFGLLAAWSLSADLSGAVVSTGVVIPEGKRKTVQHLSGGIVRQILVKEGERVQQGQKLIILDDIQARSTIDVLENQYAAAFVMRARLLAEQQNLKDMPALAEAQGTPQMRGEMAQERALFLARRASYESQLSVLRDRIHQFEEESAGHRNLMESNIRQLALIQKELDGTIILNKKGLSPTVKIYQLQRTVASLEGDIGMQKSEMARTAQHISETRSEMGSVAKKRDDDISRDLREAEVKVADIEPRLTAARDTLTQTVIDAPTEGYVLNLAIVTIGGVVEPGKAIMDIIPGNGEVAVEAEIGPTDIDDIKVGMKAEIQLSGRSSGGQASMQGEVAVVGADRLVEPHTGRPYYPAIVHVSEGEQQKILPDHMVPGMSVEVVLPVTARTLFGYLIEPLKRRFHRAFRER